MRCTAYEESDLLAIVVRTGIIDYLVNESSVQSQKQPFLMVLGGFLQGLNLHRFLDTPCNHQTCYQTEAFLIRKQLKCQDMVLDAPQCLCTCSVTIVTWFCYAMLCPAETRFLQSAANFTQSMNGSLHLNIPSTSNPGSPDVRGALHSVLKGEQREAITSMY